MRIYLLFVFALALCLSSCCSGLCPIRGKDGSLYVNQSQLTGSKKTVLDILPKTVSQPPAPDRIFVYTHPVLNLFSKKDSLKYVYAYLDDYIQERIYWDAVMILPGQAEIELIEKVGNNNYSILYKTHPDGILKTYCVRLETRGKGAFKKLVWEYYR